MRGSLPPRLPPRDDEGGRLNYRRPAAKRLRADAAERLARRDDLGVEFQLEDRGQAGGSRGLEGARELLRLFDGGAEAAKRAGIGGEIRVMQVRAVDAAWENCAPGACGSCRRCRC